MSKKPDKNPIVTFRIFSTQPRPHEIQAYLDDKGCGGSRNLAVMQALLGYVDLNQTTRIHKVDPYSGITLYVSKAKLAEVTFYSERTVQYALKDLADHKVIKKLDKHPETGCYRFKLNIYDPYLAFLEANPDHPKNQVRILAATPEQQQDDKNAMDKGEQEILEGGAGDALIKELKEFTCEIPPPIPNKCSSRSEGDGEENQHRSQPEEDNPIEQSEAVKPRDETPKKPKTGQKVNPLHHVFNSSSPDLPDLVEQFHSTFTNNRPTQYLVAAHSRFCTSILNDLFREPSLADAFPDPDDRAQACVNVLATAFQKLPFDRSDPPRSPAYFREYSGQEAISKSIPLVINHGVTGEAEPEPEPTPKLPQSQLDSELQRMYEEQWGKNWREKRQRAIERPGRAV